MKQKSLITVFMVSMTLILAILVSILVYLSIAEKIKQTASQLDTIRTSYIESRKETIKNQVKQTIEYIKHKRAQAEKRVRQEVKGRTLEAYAIASYIFEENKSRVSLVKIKKMIHDALYPVSWDKGIGYYFVEDTAGTELINRNTPDLEGKNLSHLQDSKGNYIMQVILEAATSPEKEGFCYYYWNEPGHPGVFVPKISYVKYFQPLDWIIGNGKYISDEEEIIKKEILSRIETIHCGKENYLFAGTWEGVSLSGPFVGKNMLHIEDSNGVKIVEKLIAAAKSGGDFVEYVVPKFKGHIPAPKISYAEAIPQWKWYIGSGMYVDAIETVIQEKQDNLKQVIRNYIIKSIVLLLIFWMVSFFMVWFLSRKIQTNLTLFTEFFKRSAMDVAPIAKEDVSFTEFRSLAESANQMAENIQHWEMALRESEHRLSSHLQNTPVGAVSLDLDLNIVEWNPAAESIFGYTKAEVLGRRVINLLLQQDMIAHVMHNFEEVLSNHGGQRSSNENITKTGQQITCDWYNTALYSVDGKIIGIASLVTDITERKRTEKLLIQSEKMMSVGGLAAGMAHEINNPLAGMMQNAQVIFNRLTTPMPANQKAADEAGISLAAMKNYMEKRDILRLLQVINQAGDRAARIVRNMLDFTSKKYSEKSLRNLTELMDTTVELARNDYNLTEHYDFKQISIIREYQDNLPPVLCEAGNLQQVFFNIIKNAAEAMFKSMVPDRTPNIIIRLFQTGSTIQIEIEDNGPGMDKEIQSRIFEPFFTTKDVDKGTGLGLSVSYFIIVDDHNGKLEIKSSPGGGSRFIIKLPGLPQ